MKEKDKLSKLINLNSTRINDRTRFDTRVEEINKEIAQLHDTEKESKEGKVIDNIKTDPKAFHTYANSFKQSRSKIGPLKSGQSYVSGEKEMAEILSKQYESVFSKPQMDRPFTFKQIACQAIEDIDITRNDIKEAMEAIKLSSAPGPDGIPAFLFKHFAEELSYPVTKIWRLSLDTGKMPEGTIKAFVTPIPKEGNKSEPSNYRPVSLTNHLTKIFERVLRKHLVLHLETQNLMNENQHGFRGGRSTITQLLSYYDSILSLLEESQWVQAVYLDFAKAFDKVDHSILLTKVKALGITGKIYSWLKTFLTTRVQQVIVGNYLSSEERVRSGVPQGSVLGPLLFIIMMIDIDDNIRNVFLGCFADDTRIWQASWRNVIQAELDKMYHWADKNNMEYNGKKFEKIVFGNCNDETDFISPDGKKIEGKDNIKDLGIYMSASAKFDFHINTIIKAAQTMSAWVLRTFMTRKTLPMLILLKTLIVSKVEYASILWSPSDQRNIANIENIQRIFTSKMAIFRRYHKANGLMECTTNYWERIERLKIYSLERRRERYMILYMFKIHIGLVPDLGFVKGHNIRTNTKYFPKYNRKASSGPANTIRFSSFFTMSPMLYNLLPGDLRQLENINIPTKLDTENFKGKLDKWLKLVPDQPTTAGMTRQAETNSLIDQLAIHGREVSRKWKTILRAHNGQ